MKRLLAALLAAPLVLTACSTTTEADSELQTTTSPQALAVEYPSMIEWYEAMDSESSTIKCQQRRAVSPPLIEQAKYQVICTDQTGSEANAIIYSDLSDMEDRLRFAKQQDEWIEGDWIILRGPNWTVDCVDSHQCDLWQFGFGGETIAAEDYDLENIEKESPVVRETTTTESTEPAITFEDGTHMVGTDIQPGTYRNDGTQSCYWARMSGLGGTTEDIIANDNPRGQSYVTISEDDTAFKSQLCGSWELVE